MYLLKREASPGFEFTKVLISSVYPAMMTTRRSRSSSMRLRSVSIASWPKSFSALRESVYASSMKRTPSNALSITLFVFMAVCPMYPATRSAREASTRWPFERIPSSLKMRAMMRAMVVLPVPGLPENTRWYDVGGTDKPRLLRTPWTLRKFRNVTISRLTPASPTSDLSSVAASRASGDSPAGTGVTTRGSSCG